MVPDVRATKRLDQLEELAVQFVHAVRIIALECQIRRMHRVNHRNGRDFFALGEHIAQNREVIVEMLEILALRP